MLVGAQMRFTLEGERSRVPVPHTAALMRGDSASSLCLFLTFSVCRMECEIHCPCARVVPKLATVWLPYHAFRQPGQYCIDTANVQAVVEIVQNTWAIKFSFVRNFNNWHCHKAACFFLFIFIYHFQWWRWQEKTSWDNFIKKPEEKPDSKGNPSTSGSTSCLQLTQLIPNVGEAVGWIVKAG